MTCLRINTKVLMANLFAEIKSKNSTVSNNDLKKLLCKLSTYSPVYIQSDFSINKIINCVENYPDLYQNITMENGIVIIQPGNKLPNLDFFNVSYPTDAINYIHGIVRQFVKEMY